MASGPPSSRGSRNDLTRAHSGSDSDGGTKPGVGWGMGLSQVVDAAVAAEKLKGEPGGGGSQAASPRHSKSRLAAPSFMDKFTAPAGDASGRGGAQAGGAKPSGLGAFMPQPMIPGAGQAGPMQPSFFMPTPAATEGTGGGGPTEFAELLVLDFGD